MLSGKKSFCSRTFSAKRIRLHKPGVLVFCMMYLCSKQFSVILFVCEICHVLLWDLSEILGTSRPSFKDVLVNVSAEKLMAN